MKKLVLIIIITLFLSSCSITNELENEKTTKQESEKSQQETKTYQVSLTKELLAIPPFEKENQENIPLFEKVTFSNSMELVDSIIENYEVKHTKDFKTDFLMYSMQVEKGTDGNIITSTKTGNNTFSLVSFSKSLDEYFGTPNTNYGVLVRFKTETPNELAFSFESRFGRIMLGFTNIVYPTIDVAGDSNGDPMYKYDWNNYFYTNNEWAYSFLTINKYGQKNCYIWSESNPNNYNFVVSYAEDFGSETPYQFSFELIEKGKSVTISDIWLYSYEELKQ